MLLVGAAEWLQQELGALSGGLCPDCSTGFHNFHSDTIIFITEKP